MNAYQELMEQLEDGETVEAIVFGEYGWGGYSEPSEAPIPQDKQGVAMTIEDAKPLMEGWRFNGGFGAPECYATYVWTNIRVGWVTQYDGATGLDWMPRNPADVIPDMPGG